MDAYDELVAAADPTALVVTAGTRHEPAGCLVAFASACSIDPPRYLVMLSVANHTYDVARHAEMLGVHVLGEDDHPLAAWFGEHTGDREDKRGDVRWLDGPGGVPLIDGGLAWMTGRVVQRVELGDHVGFVLSPVAGGRRREGSPLRFAGIRHLDAGHPA